MANRECLSYFAVIESIYYPASTAFKGADQFPYYDDKNFETIEGNDKLSEFYDVVKEVTETIRENMPPELQQKVAATLRFVRIKI